MDMGEPHHDAYVAEATVPTERAARYLAQLCEHLETIGPARRHGGRMHQRHASEGDRAARPALTPTDIRRSTTLATIQFDNGTCRLLVDGGTLRMRVSADDPETLELLKGAFANRLEQIARRDNLTVAWTAQA